MSEDAHRTLRIPDDVREEMARHGQPRPLWYVGPLQAENGVDIQVEPVTPEEVKEHDLPTELPAKVERPQARRHGRRVRGA